VGDHFDWCQCGTSVPGHYVETWTTANSGRSWALRSLPTVGGFDFWYSNAVSCWATSACAMAGTGTTTKPGSLYYALIILVAAASGAVAGAVSSSTNVLRPQYIYGLSCSDSSHCVAVGQNWLRPAAATIEISSAGQWRTAFTARKAVARAINYGALLWRPATYNIWAGHLDAESAVWLQTRTQFVRGVTTTLVATQRR